MITTFELKPYWADCQSFGGKALVSVSTLGKMPCFGLTSYDTFVADYWEYEDGSSEIIFKDLNEDQLSNTTVKHIKDFLFQLFDSTFLTEFEDIIKVYNEGAINKENKIKTFKDLIRKVRSIRLVKTEVYNHHFSFELRKVNVEQHRVNVKFSYVENDKVTLE